MNIDHFKDDHHSFNLGSLQYNGESPFQLLKLWLEEALNQKVNEPNAFVISTVNAESEPSSRVVYLKDFVGENLVFYTNYQSQKGRDILQNPRVSILFFWPELERQIRITGMAKKCAEELSDAYFQSRPRGSRIGAWASDQSQLISSKEELEQKYESFEKRFPGEVDRPPHWGGFEIEALRYEFWQGRPSRLHERLTFQQAGGRWTHAWIQP